MKTIPAELHEKGGRVVPCQLEIIDKPTASPPPKKAVKEARTILLRQHDQETFRRKRT
jgi:hypothetical protein